MDPTKPVFNHLTVLRVRPLVCRSAFSLSDDSCTLPLLTPERGARVASCNGVIAGHARRVASDAPLKVFYISYECVARDLAAMTSVVLKKQQPTDRLAPLTAPLKLTIPASWAGAPCSKLVKAWAKRKQCKPTTIYLASIDGTPIPDDWPWEAAVELYGSTLRVHDAVYNDAELNNDGSTLRERRDDDATLNARGAALLRRGAFKEAERAFRQTLESGAVASGDASPAAAEAATAAADGVAAAAQAATNVAAARRELLRADGTDDTAEVTRRLERGLAAARVARRTAPDVAEPRQLEAAALCRLKRWPEASAALPEDVDAPKGAVPHTIDRRDALTEGALLRRRRRAGEPRRFHLGGAVQ